MVFQYFEEAEWILDYMPPMLPYSVEDTSSLLPSNVVSKKVQAERSHTYPERQSIK